MSNEQKIRVVLYYLSVIIFLSGLPSILSSTLGYKFDRRSFKFTKAGLIAIKTQPPGANIYLNNELLNLKTPATINELLPGKYQLRFELEKFYPWSSEVDVQAGKVTRLEKVIFFPTLPNIRRLNRDKFSFFLMDEEKQVIYYLNADDGSIYKSDFDGEHSESAGHFLIITPPPLKWKLSPDREKLVYFNVNQIGVAYIQPHNDTVPAGSPFVFAYPDNKIIDVFWHSDSYHLIVASSKKIEVFEAQPRSAPILLAHLNKRNAYVSYDVHTDTLYFLDSQKAPDGNFYDNLYKLELSTHTFLFQDFIKLKTYE